MRYTLHFHLRILCLLKCLACIARMRIISKSSVWKDSFVRPVGRNCVVERAKEGNALPCSAVRQCLSYVTNDAVFTSDGCCLSHVCTLPVACNNLAASVVLNWSLWPLWEVLGKVWGPWSQSRWFCTFRVFQFRGWHFGWCLLLFTGAAILTCAWLPCCTVQSTFLFTTELMDEFDLSTRFVV